MVVYGLYVVEVGNEGCEREGSQRVLLFYWHGRHADYRAPGRPSPGKWQLAVWGNFRGHEALPVPGLELSQLVVGSEPSRTTNGSDFMRLNHKPYQGLKLQASSE